MPDPLNIEGTRTKFAAIPSPFALKIGYPLPFPLTQDGSIMILLQSTPSSLASQPNFYFLPRAGNTNPAGLSWIKYRVRYTKWGQWVREAVKGQFCVHGTTRDYPDPGQPDTSFDQASNPAYPTTTSSKSGTRHYQGRLTGPDLIVMKLLCSTSLLYKSASPAALALNVLELRAPILPGCPGGMTKDLMALDCQTDGENGLVQMS
ncbi:hypothetical protein BDV06DRAFT_25962 [Aspergillus oleicola]